MEPRHSSHGISLGINFWPAVALVWKHTSRRIIGPFSSPNVIKSFYTRTIFLSEPVYLVPTGSAAVAEADMDKSRLERENAKAQQEQARAARKQQADAKKAEMAAKRLQREQRIHDRAEEKRQQKELRVLKKQGPAEHSSPSVVDEDDDLADINECVDEVEPDESHSFSEN
jgi:hypothetical protein